MMRRTLVCLLAVVLAVSCLCYAEKTQEFQNNSGAKATGLRVVFYSSTTIISYGDAFSTVTPTGSAKEFVFSGGSVLPWGTFTVSWASSTTVRSFEWLTGDQPGSATPAVHCDTTVSATYPNLKEAIERAWDGAVICVEPGTYEIATIVSTIHNITLRGMTQSASDVVIRSPKYKTEAFFAHQSATVVLENMTFESFGIFSNDKSHVILKNVVTTGVVAHIESIIDIESSILQTSPWLSLQVQDGTHVSLRNSAVEGKVLVWGDAHFAAFDCMFRSPQSVVTAQTNTTIEVRNCTFDDLSLGIDLGGFAGTILGSGNIIAPSQLNPPTYAWPKGFVK